MITALDDQVGRIVAALEKKRHARQYAHHLHQRQRRRRPARCSPPARTRKEEREASGGVDAGSRAGSNGDLRGGKGSLYEGGVRVRRPSSTGRPSSSPRVVDEPLHMVDVMPTVLALAGAKASPDHPFDGKDIWPTVAEGKPSPHEDILINVEAFRGAIRKGNWKLVKVALLPGKTELFDLPTDPGGEEQRRRSAPGHRPRSREHG